MNISDEAVEAAARVIANEELFRADCGGYGWDAETDSSDSFMPNARKKARRYLEAAAPHQMGEQVTTRVEQVNLLNGTVVLTAKGDVLQHFNGYWFAPGSSYRHHLDEVALPATVLHKGATK